MAKTTEQKLNAARALVAKYEAALVAEAAQSDVRDGDIVTIKYGRAESVREVNGKIVGVANTDAGLVVAVIDGELNTYKVHVRNIVANVSAEGRKASPVNTVEASPVEAFENEGGAIAADDPLASE